MVQVNQHRKLTTQPNETSASPLDILMLQFYLMTAPQRDEIIAFMDKKGVNK